MTSRSTGRRRGPIEEEPLHRLGSVAALPPSRRAYEQVRTVSDRKNSKASTRRDPWPSATLPASKLPTAVFDIHLTSGL